jgi:hypothetical protein
MVLLVKSTVRILVVATAVAAALAIAAVASAATVVAKYPMDDARRTRVLTDRSGHGNHGRLLGAVHPTGRAFHFDGDGWVRVPDSPSLNPRARNITIRVGIKTIHRPGTGMTDFDLVRKGGTPQYKVELIGSGRDGVGLCKFKGTLGKATLKGTTDLVDGRWHRIECEKMSNRVTLTVDGTLEASVDERVGSIAVDKRLALGSKYGQGDWTRANLRNIVITVG